jgi:hypothetical protein
MDHAIVSFFFPAGRNYCNNEQQKATLDIEAGMYII